MNIIFFRTFFISIQPNTRNNIYYYFLVILLQFVIIHSIPFKVMSLLISWLYNFLTTLKQYLLNQYRNLSDDYTYFFLPNF